MKIAELWKRGEFWSAIVAGMMLFLGIIGSIMVALGTCVFCLSAAAAFLLGIFGISHSVLIEFNIYFLIAGILFTALSIFLFMNRRKCKDGQCKMNSTKIKINSKKTNKSK
ncbi:hypothetical protein H6503_05175 [Candidatus Woesearchaeota archaeon]|nr:hypothetical protein [Candidatus Woesearchaeota archaeon]